MSCKSIACNFSNLSNESFSLWLLLLSAFLFSGMGCFLKLASKTDGGIPSTQLVFYRASFQGFFVVLAMCLTRADDGQNEHDDEHHEQQQDDEDDSNEHGEVGNEGELRKEKPIICRKEPRRQPLIICKPFGSTAKEIQVVLARGVLGGCGFIMYFFSISAIPLGDAITIFSLYPIQTLILARVLLKEQIRITHTIATISSIIGSAFIAGPTFLFPKTNSSKHVDLTSIDPAGYITAFIGSFFGAFVIILIRKAGTLGVSTLQLLFSWATFGIIFSFIFRFIFEPIEGPWHTPPSKLSWLYILGMCTIGSFAHFLLNYAARMAPAGLASIVRSSDILFAYFWQILVLDDIISFTTILGVIFILVSLIIIALQKWNDDRHTTGTTMKEKNVESDETMITLTTTSYKTESSKLLA